MDCTFVARATEEGGVQAEVDAKAKKQTNKNKTYVYTENLKEKQTATYSKNTLSSAVEELCKI